MAGTATGITALQMDIKIEGITEEIMEIALEQALHARLHILDEMNSYFSRAVMKLLTLRQEWQPCRLIQRFATLLVRAALLFAVSVKSIIPPSISLMTARLNFARRLTFT